MKNYFSTISIFIIFMFFTSPAIFAEEARILNDFKFTLNYLNGNPNNVVKTVINGVTGGEFLYAVDTSDLYSGTIISTSDDFVHYNHGDVDIFIAKIGNYIYLLYQDWDGIDLNPVSKIYLYTIPFTGNIVVNDAYKYHRVEI